MMRTEFAVAHGLIERSPREQRAARHSLAFTMIELLVVVAIIGVLIMLLLPSVQSAREAARRVQCSQNLMQLGVALSNYAAAHRTFPPGSVNDTGPILSVPKGYHYSWTVQILPFLELDNLHRRFDFQHSVYSSSNLTARDARVSTFTCPSNGRGQAGLGDYAGCHHDVEAPIDADNHGVLYLNSRVRHEDLVDGPSFTILLGETTDASILGWPSGTRATLRNTGSRVNDYTILAPAGSPASIAGKQLQPGDLGALASMLENADMLDDKKKSAFIVDFVGGFASHHPGGANFLFCDGSVRLVKQTVDAHVYQLLGHRADGELVSDDDF
jgi:prepilin-type processing-associated H-X9-DG protein/prepilin-type N-terminal cleavage/methylation domain-containing protein